MSASLFVFCTRADVVDLVVVVLVVQHIAPDEGGLLSEGNRVPGNLGVTVLLGELQGSEQLVLDLWRRRKTLRL